MINHKIDSNKKQQTPYGEVENVYQIREKYINEACEIGVRDLEENSRDIQSSQSDDSESFESNLKNVAPISIPTSPQIIATRQSQSVRKSKKMITLYKSSTTLSEKANEKKLCGFSEVEIEGGLDLTESESSLWFYQTPTNALNSLLELAKSEDESKKFSNRDLSYVLKCCEYTGISPFIEAIKLEKLALSILSYLAKNKYKLSRDAVIILAKKLIQFNKKTLPMTILTLSYMVDNGHTILSIVGQESFEQGITWLMNNKEDFHTLLPIIVVALNAKSRLGIQLSIEELSVLKRALAYIGDRDIPDIKPIFPSISPVLSPYATEDRLAIYRTYTREIANIKNLTKLKKLLSKNELLFTIHRWNDPNEVSTKRKIIHILNYAVINKQHQLPETNNVSKLLASALNSSDRKIQTYGITTLGYLVVSCDPEQKIIYLPMLSQLNSALSIQRVYALKALNLYIERFSNGGITDISKWVTLLKKLENDCAQKVSSSALFALSRLENKIDHLENLLLDKETCQEALPTFLNAAQQKLKLSDKVLINLGIIVQDDINYPMEARKNALIILRKIAKNSHAIPTTIVDIIIKKIVDNGNLQICNMTLSILGYYIHHREASQLKILLTKPLLDQLFQLLQTNELILNVTFVLKCIIERLDVISFEVEFNKLFTLLSNIVNNSKYESNIKSNALLIILHGANKGFDIDPAIQDGLSCAFINAEDDEVKIKIIDIFKFMNQKTEIVSFTESVLSCLITLLKNEKETLTTNACYILCEYVNKSTMQLTETILVQLGELLILPSTTLAASEIFRKIAEKKWGIPLNILKIFGQLLVNDVDIIRINSAHILNKAIRYNCLNKEIFLLLQNAINDKNMEVVEKNINTLSLIIKKDSHKINALTVKTCEKMANIINKQQTNVDVKINIVFIYSQISLKNIKLTMQSMHELRRALKYPDKKLRQLILDCIQSQLKYYKDEFSNICVEEAFVNESSKLKHKNEIQIMLVDIENLINDEELLSATISTIEKATKLGYDPSKNFLESLADILFTYDKCTIRKHAATILCQATCKFQSEKISFAKQLETLGNSLEDCHETSINRWEALKKISELAQKKGIITKNNMMTFEFILQNYEINFFDGILATLYPLIKSGQSLSKSFTIVLTKQMAILLEKKNIFLPTNNLLFEFALTLSGIIKNESTIKENQFRLFEKLIITYENIKPDYLLNYLIAIEIGIKKLIALDKKLVEKLLSLLSHETHSIQRSAVKLMFMLSTQDCYRSFFTDSMANSVIKAIGPSKISADTTTLELFDYLSHKITLPDDIKIIVDIRKSEKNLSNTKLDIYTRLNAADVLKKNVAILSQKTVQTLELWLSNENEACRFTALEIFKELQKISFPFEVNLLKMIAECFQQLPTSQMAYEILNQQQKQIQLFPEIIDILFNAMRTHHVRDIRRKSCFLLTELSIFYPYSITQERNTIIKLEILSYNLINSNLDMDINYLKKRFSKLINIIKESKSLCSITVYDVLCEGVAKNYIAIEELIGIFNTSLNNLSAAQYKALFTILENQCILSGITLQKIILLTKLLKKEYSPVDSKFISSLIYKFLESTDDSLKDKIIIFFYNYVEKNDLLTQNELNQLSNLMMVIDENYPFVTNTIWDQYFLRLLSKLLSHSMCYIGQIIPYFNQERIAQHYSLEMKRNITNLLSFVYRRNLSLFLDSNFIINSLKDKLFGELTNNDRLLVDETISEFVVTEQVNILLTVYSNGTNLSSILNMANPNAICRQILSDRLLNNIKISFNGLIQELQIEEFYRYLSDLEIKFDYQLYSIERDNFLELLALKQQKEQFTITQVNQLMVILKYLPSPLDPLAFVRDSGNDVRLYFIKKLLEQYPSKINLNTSIPTNTHELFNNLVFNVQIISNFFESIDKNVTQEQIFEFLIFMKKYHFESYFISLFTVKKVAYTLDKLMLIFKKHLIKIKIETVFKNIAVFSDKKEYFSQATLRPMLFARIIKIISLDWNFDNFIQFLENLIVKTKNNPGYILVDVVQALDIVIYYELPEQIFYSHDLCHDPATAVNALHAVGMSKYFTNGCRDKEPAALICQLKELNRVNLSIDLLSNKITRLLETSQKMYRAQIVSVKQWQLERPIKNWSKSDIQEWAKIVKEHATESELLPQILAVIMRACYLHHQYKPRYAQLLAVLVLLYSDHNKGRLAQVGTGEGKSTIIAMLATIKALRGENVDIVTSSPILASRDALAYKTFYELFNLTVASNEDLRYIQGLKSCYQDNIAIVYGNSNNFQFDILRDEYSLLGTRGRRGFQTVIIDEVDNLLIDEGAKLAMLANTMPGMNYLTPLLIALWKELERINANFYTTENELYYTEKNTSDNTQEEFRIFDKINYISERLKLYVTKIMDEKNEFHIKTPEHLKKFVECQTPKWIDNAIFAYYEYQESHHYTIGTNDDGTKVIIPVDFANTGVVQNGTTWGDGLQQFLQIKHGLKVSSETLLTNFISNLAFIKRYSHNIYGITGTLGSDASKKLLSEIYSIDFVNIPQYRDKQFKELPSVIESSESSWINEIALSAIREAEIGRVVLILCETMKFATRIQAVLFKSYQGTLKSYIDSDDSHARFLNEVLLGNTIIVATNLAGRGTDIKISANVIQKGGLHVCFTFLPENLRVEAQGFGRTSRRGEPGTAQLILNVHDVKLKLRMVMDGSLSDPRYRDIKMIKQWRDKKEKAHLENIRTYELNQINNKDLLFEKFRLLLKRLNEFEIENAPIFKKLLSWGLPAKILQYLKDTKNQFKRGSVEERWGLWLKQCDFNQNKNIILKKYNEFESTILAEYKTDSVIKNPSYYINEGNEYLGYANSLVGKIAYLGFYNSLYELAISCYKNALKLDPIFTYIAHYNKACALIKLATGTYKLDAKSDLFEAKKIIEENIFPQTQAILQILGNPSAHLIKNNFAELSQQLFNQNYILELLTQSIERTIEQIEHSQKLIDITIHSTGEKKLFCKLTKDETLKTLDQIESNDISVTFHDLKANTNLWATYQAKETFKKDKAIIINIIFDDRNIKKNINMNLALKQQLPINRHMPEVQKDNSKTEKIELNNKDEQELIGAWEKLSYAKNKVIENVSYVVTESKDKVISLLDPIQKQCQEKWDGRTNYYELSKQIPLNITIKQITLISGLSLLAQINAKFETDKMNIRITLFDLNKEHIERFIDLKSTSNVKVSYYDRHRAELSLKKIAYNDFTKLATNKEEIYTLHVRYNQLTEAVKFITDLTEKLKNLDASTQSTFMLTLQFIQLSQAQVNSILDMTDAAVTLKFSKLSYDSAEKIIHHTYEYNGDALFQGKHLNSQSAKTLISQSERNEQGFNVNLVAIDHVLQDLNLVKTELIEYETNGYVYFFDVMELNQIPWKSVGLVALLGCLQIAGGVALSGLTAGFGANVGASLVLEGLGDIFRSISSIYSRELCIGSYGVQKSFSLAMTLASAGWTTYKLNKVVEQAEKATMNGVELLDDIVVMARLAKKQLTEVQGLRSAGTKLLESTVRKSVHEVANGAMNNASHYSLTQFSPTIAKFIRKNVKLQFTDGIDQLLNKIYAIDKILGTPEFEIKVQRKTEEIINGMKIGCFGYVVDAKIFLTFHSKLSNELQTINEQLSNFKEIISQKLDLSEEAGDEIYKLLTENEILLTDGRINIHKLYVKALKASFTTIEIDEIVEIKEIDYNKFNFWKYDHCNKAILDLCQKMHAASESDYYEKRNALITLVTKVISEQLKLGIDSVTSVIKSSVSYGLDKAMDSISDGIKPSSELNKNEKEYEYDSLRNNDESRDKENNFLEPLEIPASLSEPFEFTLSKNSFNKNLAKKSSIFDNYNNLSEEVPGEGSDLLWQTDPFHIYLEVKLLNDYEKNKANNYLREQNPFNTYAKNNLFNSGFSANIDNSYNTKINSDKINGDKLTRSTKKTKKSNKKTSRNMGFQETLQNSGDKSKIYETNKRLSIVDNIQLDKINDLSKNIKEILLNHSLILTRESIVRSINETAKKEIAQLEQDCCNLKIISEKQHRDFLEKIKELIKCYIALILVDIKISVEINALTQDKSLFSAEQVLAEADIICNECFQSSQQNGRYQCLINHLNKFSTDHKDVNDLLNKVQSLFKQFNQPNFLEKNMNNHEIKSNNNDNKELASAKIVNDNATQSDARFYMDKTVEGFTVFSQLGTEIASNISTVMAEKEKSKREIINAKTKATKQIINTINTLAEQTKVLVQSQNELFTATTNQFMNLIKVQTAELEAIEAKRESMVKNALNQVDRVFEILAKNPDNVTYQSMYEKQCGILEKRETEVENSLAAERSNRLENIKHSKGEYLRLVGGFKSLDTQVLTQAMALQDQMQNCLNQLLDIKEQPKSNLTNSQQTQPTQIGSLTQPGGTGIFAPQANTQPAQQQNVPKSNFIPNMGMNG